MRGTSKLLVVAVAIALLATGLAACGGDGNGGSTTAESAAADANGKADDSPGGQAEREDEQERGAGEDHGSSGGDAGSGSSFTPKQHDDSGGGSAQFRVKGGDNSIQEFGAEADESELEEAAIALHGFLDARAVKDWAAACSYLAASVTKSLQQLTATSKRLKGRGCPELLATLSAGVPQSALAEAAQANVGSLRVEGDQSFLLYRGARDTIYAVPMDREDGEWKVASLAGTPLS